MKSIKEIENMSLEELMAVSSDEATAVPEGFAERIKRQVEVQKIAKDLENDTNRTRTVRWIGAAAAVTLLAGTALGIASRQNQPKDTFDDPYLAYAELEKAFATARKIVDEQPAGCSVLRGIQMEGPYFSYKKRGAQNADYLKEPDFEGFRKLYEDCGGLVRIVDVAPELPGAAEFVAQASKLCTVSVAHTDSDYDHAKAGFDAGATHVTHLYNAMPAINHRTPGLIPAAVENKNVRAEIICDGYHIHAASVRLAFSMFGADRMVLISDSGRCAGMPEGSKFELGGQDAWLRNGVARLADGTIACSAANLYDCMVKAMEFGIPEEDAVRAASYNPACAIAADKEVGSIEEGKVADFLVCSDNYATKRVFLGGVELK